MDTFGPGIDHNPLEIVTRFIRYPLPSIFSPIGPTIFYPPITIHFIFRLNRSGTRRGEKCEERWRYDGA